MPKTEPRRTPRAGIYPERRKDFSVRLDGVAWLHGNRIAAVRVSGSKVRGASERALENLSRRNAAPRRDRTFDDSGRVTALQDVFGRLPGIAAHDSLGRCHGRARYDLRCSDQ